MNPRNLCGILGLKMAFLIQFSYIFMCALMMRTIAKAYWMFECLERAGVSSGGGCHSPVSGDIVAMILPFLAAGAALTSGVGLWLSLRGRAWIVPSLAGNYALIIGVTAALGFYAVVQPSAAQDPFQKGITITVVLTLVALTWMVVYYIVNWGGVSVLTANRRSVWQAMWDILERHYPDYRKNHQGEQITFEIPSAQLKVVAGNHLGCLTFSHRRRQGHLAFDVIHRELQRRVHAGELDFTARDGLAYMGRGLLFWLILTAVIAVIS